jgi:hypothetical protein
MSMRIKKLEKENASVRTKCETMNLNIIEMAQERTDNQKQLAAAAQREKKLEKLCRTLQHERNHYRDKVSDSNGIEGRGSPVPSDASFRSLSPASELQESHHNALTIADDKADKP